MRAVAAALIATLGGCAPEGLACGTIRCEPGQLCAAPTDPCDPLRAGGECRPGDECEVWASREPGCFRRAPAGPGLCFDVPPECEDMRDCDCLSTALAPYRCVHVDEHGYVSIERN